MTDVAGIILAGGLARRMGGGDKSLRTLGGRAILDWVVERARAQVSALALNANGDGTRFRRWDLPVVPDSVAGNPGPLAGVLAGLDWAAAVDPNVSYVATFACDAPFLPLDLVAKLQGAVADGADLACATSAGRHHPVFGLWPVALREPLRRALVDEGIRKVDQWTARFRLAAVAFDAAPVDPFFNANRPGDLEAAEALLARLDRPGGPAESAP